MAPPAEAASDEPTAMTRMMGSFLDAVLRGQLGRDDPGFDAGLVAQEALEAAIRSARNASWETV